MRTTVTLDDDLYRLLEQAARRTNESFKGVLNDAVRAGLGVGGQPPVRRAVRLKTFRAELRTGIDSAKLKQLLNEGDDEEFRRKAGL